MSNGPWLLGGQFSPIGWDVRFIEAQATTVESAFLSWRRSLGHRIETRDAGEYPQCLHALEPLESPWTTELLIDCGSWTTYLTNQKNGGDPAPGSQVIAERLSTRWVIGVHSLRYGPGHQSTQLYLNGPGGEPRRSIRSLAAHAEDGRWQWHERGEVQSFEEPECYSAKRIKDRLTREVLVRYLDRLAIHVDNDSWFGAGRTMRQSVTWPTNPETLDEAQSRLRIRW